MDSSQSSSDTQRGMDPVERRMSPCNRAPASEELGGPTPPTGYGRVARRRAPAPSSGAPAAPGTPRALHFAKWAQVSARALAAAIAWARTAVGTSPM